MHAYKPGDLVRLQSETTAMRVSDTDQLFPLKSPCLVFCEHVRKTFKEEGIYRASYLVRLQR
jgi:hypothetical protein